jgi:dihydroorotase
MPTILKDALVLDPRSKFHKKRVDIHIDKGSIKKIAKNIKLKGKAIEEKNLCVSPGWFDLNVRINDPGFEFKETLEETFAQASIGGFTKILTLPATDPIIQSKDLVQNLVEKGNRLGIGVFPCAALTKDSKGEQLNDLKDLLEAGAVAFTDDINSDNTEIIAHTLQYLGDSEGILMSRPLDMGLANGFQVNEGIISTKLGLKGLAIEAESLRIARDIRLLKMNGGRLHFSKVSTPEGLNLIKKAKAEGLNLSCDVPFYLFCLDETRVGTYDTSFKLDPPLRSKKDMNGLSKFLLDGTIDGISSAHSPLDTESRDLEFDHASFGARTLATAFPAFWSAMNEGLKPEHIAEIFSLGPARVLGVEVPVIEKDAAVDLTIFQLNTKWDYKGQKGRSLDDPFSDSRFSSRVLGTIYKGQVKLQG